MLLLDSPHRLLTSYLGTTKFHSVSNSVPLPSFLPSQWPQHSMTQLLSGQSTQESWVPKRPRLLGITPGDWMLTFMLKKGEPGPVQSGQPPYSFQAPGCRATLSLSASQGNTSLAYKDTTWDGTLLPIPPSSYQLFPFSGPGTRPGPSRRSHPCLQSCSLQPVEAALWGSV